MCDFWSHTYRDELTAWDLQVSKSFTWLSFSGLHELALIGISQWRLPHTRNDLLSTLWCFDNTASWGNTHHIQTSTGVFLAVLYLYIWKGHFNSRSSVLVSVQNPKSKAERKSHFLLLPFKTPTICWWFCLCMLSNPLWQICPCALSDLDCADESISDW